MASIQKYQAELQKIKATKQKAIDKIKDRTEKVAHTVISAGTSYVIGVADQRKTNPLPDLFGLDKKLVWGIASHILAANVKGKIGESAAAVGDGLINSYAYCEGAGKGYTIEGVDYDSRDYVVDDPDIEV